MIVRWGLLAGVTVLGVCCLWVLPVPLMGGMLCILLCIPRAVQYGILGMWVIHRDRKTGQLNVSSSYFMPYSVCPECGVEALHWMEQPDLDSVRDIARNVERERGAWVQETPGHWVHFIKRNGDTIQIYGDHPPRLTPKQRMALSVKNGSFDLIRTCRECEHTWGQKVAA